ncbi:hypothetical protein OQA88_4946 [Cercophora sp. LCS_1]
MPSPSASAIIRLITYNIRLQIPSGWTAPGEEPWSARCEKLCGQLKFMTAGRTSPFICLQEVTHPQLLDIQASLGSNWGYIGLGRDDGERGGEYCPVFFRTDHWQCERHETSWLSPTPENPGSKGWDAPVARVVSAGLFHHNETSSRIVVMSTHLDFEGKVAREESAHLLLKLAGRWLDGSHGPAEFPVFLGGDFNSDRNSAAYKTLSAPDGMADISGLVPEALKYGHPEITYTGFLGREEDARKIDFLFVLGQQALEFLTFGILPNRFDDGVFLSDHRPVVADIDLGKANGGH